MIGCAQGVLAHMLPFALADGWDGTGAGAGAWLGLAHHIWLFPQGALSSTWLGLSSWGSLAEPGSTHAPFCTHWWLGLSSWARAEPGHR
jgi:hypothetical protein